MEHVDLEGLFWLAGYPDNKVPGRVTFDHVNGSKLDLNGAFLELIGAVGGSMDSQTQFEVGDRPLGSLAGVRIQGLSGNQKLTLENCIRIETKQAFPSGTAREVHYVEKLFLGIHLGEADPLEFASAHMQIRHFDQWIGMTGIEVSFQSEDGSDRVSGVQVTCDPIEQRIVSTPDGKFGLDI